jgi:hypothetical protein
MIRKSLVAVAAFAALALLAATMPPIATTSAKELTDHRSKLFCAAKKPQKLPSSTPAPQQGDNRRKPIYYPPKTLKGKPMW